MSEELNVPCAERGLLAWIAALWIAAPVVAVDPASPPTQHLRRHWSRSDGLPRDPVTAITCGKDGFLWVGTPRGLARFDGTAFEPSTLPLLASLDVQNFACADDGTLWIAARTGLYKLRDGKARAWRASDGLPDEHVTSVAIAPGGAIWFGMKTGGLGLLVGDNVRVLGKDALGGRGSVWGIEPDGPESGWVATVDGLVRVDGWRVTSRYGLESGLPSLMVSSVARRADGTLLVGTFGGLVEFDGKRVTRVYGRADGLADPRVFRVATGPDGAAWAATAGGGLAKLGPLGLGVLDARSGLPSDTVLSVFAGNDGTVWVGTSGGLTRLSDGRALPWRASEGVPSAPFGVFVGPDGEVLAAIGAGGVLRRDGARFAPVALPAEAPRAEAALRASDGSLWTAAGDTAYRLAEGKWTTISLPVNAGEESRPRSVSALAEGPDGTMWVGTSHGLFAVRQTVVTRLTTSEGLPHNQVTGLAVSGETLWVATVSGLATLRAGEVRVRWPAPGVQRSAVFSVAVDTRGRVWAGAEIGMIRVNGERVDEWSSLDDLPSKDIFGITIDARGTVWLCTPAGVLSVEAAEFDRILGDTSHRVAFTEFGTADGLPHRSSGSLLRGAGCALGADGTLWVCTAGGLAQFPPPASARTPGPPPAFVRGASVDGRPYQVDRGLELDASFRRLEVRFGAVELARPEDVRFRYRLDGLHSEWVDAGENGSLTLATLPPGHVTLLAQARLGDGPWGEKPASLAIYRRPTLLESWWFYLAASCVVGAGLWGWHRRRLSKQTAQFQAVQHAVIEERARLAGDIHDSLAQSFAGIAMQLEAAEDAALSGDKLASAVGVGKARQIARFGLSEARRSVMSLRPEHTLGGGPLKALVMLAERTTVRGLLSCEVVDSPTPIELHYELSLAILQTAQEAISNSIRHGQPTTIALSLVERDGVVVLTVEDNGKGFPASQSSPQEGTGIPAMRARAERLGGTLTIEQPSGGGVRVRAVYRRVKESAL